MTRLFSRLRKGIKFFNGLHGIVFFGGYPFPEREKDGYFIRIRAIDDIFSDRHRIYIDDYSLPGRQALFEKVSHQTYVIRSGGSLKHSIISKILMMLCIMKCRTIYFHSIYQINRSRKLLFYLGINKILDVHGVVPEELGYNNDHQNKALYNQIEHHAVTRANILIVVTERMRQHLEKKYPGKIQGEFIHLPILSELRVEYTDKPLKNGKQVVIYAGGLQKWQQVSKMVDAMLVNQDHFEFRFFCPNPETLQQMLPPQLKTSNALIIGSKSNEEILAEYQESHFGFILRENNIVNQVACPTKLIEYLALGVIPIIDSPEIGDFPSLGMQSISIGDFLRGDLPGLAEQCKMRETNRKVYQSLKQAYEEGKTQLRQQMPLKQPSLQLFKGETDPPPEPCDILIQVGDFLTGGLENVVLGINNTLISKGYKLGLLVLGACGPAVEQARASGTAVYVRKFEPHSYKRLLEALSPQLLLSHYSIEGANICHGMGIPIIQVIHSLYFWFNESQLEAFQKSVSFTQLFIAVSQFAKTYSVKHLGVPEDKCIVIPNGINVQRVRKIDCAAERKTLRKKYNFSNEDFVFISISAINYPKNIMGLIKGFQKAMEFCPHAKLALLGPIFSDEIFNEIRSIIKQFGINQQIFYLGETEEALKYYPMADAFIHTAFFEGGPLVLLEALAFDLPIISTKVGFATQLRNSRGVTLISPPVDILEYAGAIEGLKSNALFEESLSKCIQSTYNAPVRPDIPNSVIDKMDLRVMHQNYLQVIEYVLSKKSISPADMSLNLWTDFI